MKTILNEHSQYPQRHLDQSAATHYQKKFKKSWTRRLSAAREMQLITKALMTAVKLAQSDTGKKLSELTLLDYPCGAGRFSSMFASRVAGYMAGDHSEHMVHLTEQVVQDAGLGDRLLASVTGDLRKTPLTDNCVDLAACIRLLHHFPESLDRIAILRELRRVSRGPLIVTFHDADAIKQRLHRWKRAKAGKACLRVLIHPDDFKEEARAAGWRFVKSWRLCSLTSGLCVAVLT